MATLWPLLKIALVFVLMLAGIRAKLGIGTAVAAGSLVLALLFGMGPISWLQTAADGVLGQDTLVLVVIITLILMLSDTMERTRQNEQLMEIMRTRITHPRFRLVFFPSLIGFLPMPGGAVFSAPMLEGMARSLDIPPRRLVNINYWFRHVWEPCWPLYPGILLAASLADLPLYTLVGIMLPGTLACLALGWWFLLRPGVLALPDASVDREGTTGSMGRVLALGSPLIIAIAGALALEGIISWLAPGVAPEYGVIIALAAATAWCFRQNRLPADLAVRILFKKRTWVFVWLIVAIFMFKEVLMRAGVVDELSAMGGTSALLATALLLPLLVGVVSGVTVAFVGATFPLIIGLAQQAGVDSVLPYLVMGMFAGFTGIMISPIHACFLLSCEYFKVDISKAWRELARPAFALLAFGFAYTLLVI